MCKNITIRGPHLKTAETCVSLRNHDDFCMTPSPSSEDTRGGNPTPPSPPVSQQQLMAANYFKQFQQIALNNLISTSGAAEKKIVVD
uniref:Uncharacterized protein n=1 Tax=Steinernema glaseri TaxID=37863 RepID=A0A1I7Z065_9BILA